MSRFLMVILLLTVFFLTGMLFGMNQEASESPGHSHMVESKLDQKNSVFKENKEENNTDTGELINENEEMGPPSSSMSLTLTQKTASLLEKGIKGFSEIVVGILHQIALLFF